MLFLRDLSDEICRITLNINAPESYSIKNYDTVQETLNILHKKITLGFNIYKEDFDVGFLIGLIKKYDLKKVVRIGIASPILGHNNEHVPIDKHRAIAKK